MNTGGMNTGGDMSTGGAGGGGGCTDTCEFAGDGVCDEPLLCTAGTDCSDCNQECTADGADCIQNDECCGFATESSLCVDFLSGATQCAAYCTTNAECATGCCVLLTSGLGACGPAEECSVECRAIGETCDSDLDCCDVGSLCTDDGIGPKTCGAGCTTDLDCQSGCCVRRQEDSGQACFAPEFCGDCGPSGCACEQDCLYANDGECDDGSFGAFSALCAPGTDCSDCGPRAVICNDDCGLVNAVCEDDGYTCSYGADCTDCGARTPPSCDYTCYWNGDGTCDDSGPGAAYAVCGYGTDCDDCGPR